MSNDHSILALICGVMATFILCLSYLVKNKKTFLFFSLLGDIVYGLTFVFVNSWGAGIITLLSCLQYVFVLFFERKQKQLPKSIAFMFIICFIVAGLCDFVSLWDIIPIVTYIWFTIALYYEDVNKIKVMYLIANISLAIYDIMVGAYANAFEDAMESFFLLVIIIRNVSCIQRKHRGKSVTATLKNLFNEVIGVNYFDLQSDIKKVETSEIHNNSVLQKIDSVIAECSCYKYG